MSVVWSILSWSLALPEVILLTFLAIELLAALYPAGPGPRSRDGTRPSVAIVVPAHDEASVIGATLDSLQPQLAAGDRLVVVADNCTDRTAAIAIAKGATVVHRSDLLWVGKGYALDRGMRYLREDPPQVVIMVDADTPANPGAVDALARLAHECQRPVQAGYALELPTKPKWYHRVGAFAMLVKNVIRPSGLARLGLPCLLMGSGMAFPWQVIGQADLASGSLTEDLALTAQLAARGHSPLFCSEARFRALVPGSETAVRIQRMRWEHGHLDALLSQVPHMTVAAIAQRRLDLLGMTLEMAVPPLSLLVLAWTVSVVVTVLAGAAGASWVPAALLAVAAVPCSLGVVSVWLRWGRDILPLRWALHVPRFVLSKVPLYAAFVTHRQTSWVRTQRDPDDLGDGSPVAAKAPPGPAASR
jgi:cellulose synthase/poly-beta-1,6-N-acetylglucosamine synthase-like glycosyltransferase